VSDEIMTEEATRAGMSRRNLIKAGAIVGGAVWVAPVVDSFVTVASAVSNPAECAGQTCTSFTICFDPGSDCVCATTAAGGGFCVSGSTPCSGLQACGAGNTCPPGSTALLNTCCGACICYAGPGCVETRGLRARTDYSGATIGKLAS